MSKVGPKSSILMALHSICQPGGLCPRGSPMRARGLGALPEGEVQRIPLQVSRLYAGAGLKVVYGLAGKLAVAGKEADGEIYIAVCYGICMALFYEGLHQLDYLGYVLGSAGIAGGRLGAEALRILPVFLYILIRKLRHRSVLLVGPADELVVYICKVGYELYLVALIFQIPLRVSNTTSGLALPM